MPDKPGPELHCTHQHHGPTGGMTRRAAIRGGIGLAAAGALAAVSARPAFGEAFSDAPYGEEVAPYGTAAVPRQAYCGTLDVPQPDLHTKADWGARPPAEPVTVLDHRPTTFIVHHTAGSNTNDFSLARAYDLARGIQNFHMDDRGWIDSGQQWTISRGGYILEGRDRSHEVLQGGTQHVMGAHVGGYNTYLVGIEHEGMYMEEAPTQMLWDSMVQMCAHICSRYQIPTSMIRGHRDYNATLCPGDVLYSMLPQLRQEVADLLGEQPPPAADWPLVRLRSSGESVRTVQYLLREHGYTDIEVDGVYWLATANAVRRFQMAHRLLPTMRVDERTWLALVVAVRDGSAGEAVKAVQSQLNRQGYQLAVDGAFGFRTDSALRAFQWGRRVDIDGVAGPITWRHLTGA